MITISQIYHNTKLGSMIWTTVALVLFTPMLMSAVLGYSYHVTNAQSFSKCSSTKCEDDTCYTSTCINNNCHTSVSNPTELLNSMPQIKSAAIGTLKINGFVNRSDCSDFISPRCPEVSDSNVRVTGYSQGLYTPIYWDGSLSNEPRQISIPVGAPYAVVVEKPYWDGTTYPATFWRWEEGYIYGSCTGHNLCMGLMTTNGATITVNLHWGCVSSPFGRC